MMMRLWLPFLVVISLQRAHGLALPITKHAAPAEKAMREWLLAENRFQSICVDLGAIEDDSDGIFVVSTNRKVTCGEVLFKLDRKSIWSAADAYRDKDMGPKLRDFAGKAGPGFGVVALAGAVAAEKVRRYRKIEGQGNAPESIGFSIPSVWGAFARWIWQDESKNTTSIDESLMDTVSQGVQLIVPLLDVTARRAWSSAAADDAKPPFLSEEWAVKAMFEDGSALSWQRGELENISMRSFAMVLDQQEPPPLHLRSGVGSLIPKPFLDDTSPETWPSGEPFALIPLVKDLYSDDEGCINAVLGSPPPDRSRGGEEGCIWCVATRDLENGERIALSRSANQ